MSVQVGGSIRGVAVSQIRLLDERGCNGLAVSPDGSLMAISNWLTHMISVYSLPDGALVRSFGGRGPELGHFDDPYKLCFNPLRDDSLLVADGSNQRVQEVTITGEHDVWVPACFRQTCLVWPRMQLSSLLASRPACCCSITLPARLCIESTISRDGPVSGFALMALIVW